MKAVNKFWMAFYILIVMGTSPIFAADKLPTSFKHYKSYVIRKTNDHMQGKVYLAPELLKNTVKIKPTNEDESSKIRIIAGDDVLNISFDSGASDDPSFTIQINQARETSSLVGETLYISAGKKFYTKSGSNNYYVQPKKFHIVNNKIIEMQQPFYLVNQDCKTSTTLVMYTKKCGEAQKVAVLPANAQVKILLAEYGDNTCKTSAPLDNEGKNPNMNFLVATPFGLVGWVSTRGGYLQTAGKPLGCIRYIGD